MRSAPATDVTARQEDNSLRLLLGRPVAAAGSAVPTAGLPTLMVAEAEVLL